MAKLPAGLANSITSYYGILELVGFLSEHPKEEYVYGEGEGTFTLSNHDIREIVEDFQRDNVLTPDQVKVATADAATFRTLYARLLQLGSEKQTSIPDKESRDIIYRAYQDHQKKLVEQKDPKTSGKTIGESVRATEKYWRTKELLSTSITRALSPYMESSETSGVYATQMHDRLVAELAPLLEQINTSDPLRAARETRDIVEQAMSHSRTWQQLENLVVSEGKSFENTKASLTTLLNQEKIVKADIDSNREKLSQLTRTHGPTPSQAKEELQNSLNTWQRNAGAGRNAPNELGNDVVAALQKAVIETVSEPNIWDRFGKQEDLRLKAVRRALSDELIDKYNLTKVDRDRLIESALANPSTTAYINRVTNGLEVPRGEWVDVLGLRPTNLVAYVAKNAGVDPFVVNLTRHGVSGEQLAKQLLQSGYSESDIALQLGNLQSFMGNNQGLIGGIYKSRLAYDQTLVKIRTALSPTNIPIVRNIYGAYHDTRLSIAAAYNGFLGNHRLIAFLVSPDHRFKAWAGWINKLAINSNLPNWFRTGLTFYKNGGYSADGFIGAVKAHYRIKFGKWLIAQGAKAGGEKLFGKFLAWAGAGLVTGTLTGGAGFAVQAGVWLAQQVGQAPKAIKNADIIAGWVLKNIAGLAVLAGIAGPTIIGALIGLGAGLLAFFFGLATGPLWLILGAGMAIGMLLGYLYSQAAAIGAWASAGLSSLGAGIGAWFVGVVDSLGAVAASAGTIIFTTLSLTLGFTWLGFDAVITSKVESRNEHDQSSFNYPGFPPNLNGIVSNCGKMDLGKEITDDLMGQLDSAEKNFMPDDNFAHNEKTRMCIKPTMIIMHWSGGHGDDNGNDATRNTLIERVIEVFPGQFRSNVLACQLGTDTGEVMFMQPFYENGVEMSQCAGEWNSYAIQNEMAGTDFTDRPGGPPVPIILERSLEVTCLMMKSYNIPVTQIFGHYQVPNNGGKTDPGAAFLQNVFIPKIKERCG